MKYTLFLACFVAALQAICGDEVTSNVASTFMISEAEAQKCIDKYDIKLEDVQAMGTVAAQKSDAGVGQEQLRKTGCLFSCIWQKQEWMEGATLKLDRILRIVDVHTKNNSEIRETYYNIINKCMKEVEGMTNPCEVSRDFSVCLLKDMPHNIAGGAHHGHRSQSDRARASAL